MNSYICEECGQDEYGNYTTRWTSDKEEIYCPRCKSEKISKVN
jgi:DNA-directed RNA polymerase subunit RPC12/RpoP